MLRTVLALFVALLAAFACGSAQDRATGVRRLRLEIEVDVARARNVGWTAPDDAGVMALAEGIVQERLAAMGREVRSERMAGTQRFVVTLPSIDARDPERIQGLVHSLGVCEFLFAPESTPAGSETKLEAWRQRYPELSLEEFNLLPPEAGGPPEGVALFETLFRSGEGEPVRGPSLPLRLSPDLADHFGAADLARTYFTSDSYGYPGIGFEIEPSRVDDFARVTEAHVGRRMAIVIEGKVRSTPMLQTRLTTGGIIEGRFDPQEVKRLREAIASKAGPLRVVEVR